MRCGAVDDVVLFAQRQLAVLAVVVAQGDEQQRAAATVLLLDPKDGRGAAGLAADPQRLVELQAPAGPHAVAIVRRRQETAARRVAVDAEAGGLHRVLEERPVPERRQRFAVGRGRLAEGGGDALDQVAAQLIVGFFLATDPGGESGLTHAWLPMT